jgi:hypothetical protein
VRKVFLLKGNNLIFHFFIFLEDIENIYIRKIYMDFFLHNVENDYKRFCQYFVYKKINNFYIKIIIINDLI